MASFVAGTFFRQFIPLIPTSYAYAARPGVLERKLCSWVGAAGQPDSGTGGPCCSGADHGTTSSGDAADELHPQQRQESQSPQPLRGAVRSFAVHEGGVVVAAPMNAGLSFFVGTSVA